MSQVDEFIKNRILAYPGMYTNRTAVLHHTLCVIGNGCRWAEDGTIVSVEADPAKPWSKEAELENIESTLTTGMFANLDPDSKVFLRGEMVKRMEEDAKVAAEAEHRVRLQAPIEHIYPQSSYALLMNIPDNVTPDWREACEEMKVVAIQEGWKF